MIFFFHLKSRYLFFDVKWARFSLSVRLIGFYSGKEEQGKYFRQIYFTKEFVIVKNIFFSFPGLCSR